MSKKEMQQIARQMLDVYRGILFHNQAFASGNSEENIYDFACPRWEELRSQYNLEAVAGKGSDFVRAKRLLHYLAGGLTHASWYDNHIACNALALLAYSFRNPDHGINCLNKAKILVECCLAVGIYARRVRIMPMSPYDFDNHVVAEIYDRASQKWIMLDPTTDGYFVDEEKTPLSLLQMRSRFANGEFLTFAAVGDSLKDVQKLQKKYLQTNMYICKNLFCFEVEQYAGFGEKGGFLYVVPCGCSIKETKRANLMYRIANLSPENEGLRKVFEERLEALEKAGEPQRTALQIMEKAPV